MKKIFLILSCFAFVAFSPVKYFTATGEINDRVKNTTVQNYRTPAEPARSVFFSIQPFFSAGRFSFTVPSGVTKVSFEAVGGGGGSGGTFNGPTYDYGGGGGGSGAFAKGFLNVNAGDVIDIVIGSGGANGANSKVAPTAGTTGGSTTISIGSRIVFTAPGGNGGSAGTVSRPGFGGLEPRENVSDLIKCVLTSYTSRLSAGGAGLFNKSGGPFLLTGIPGTVYSAGEYNALVIFSIPIVSGGSTYSLFPYYGSGGGYGTVAANGYVVLNY